MHRSSRWEQLNAYLDGELPPRARAALERTLRTDPELARELARLRALKAGLRRVSRRRGMVARRPVTRRSRLSPAWAGAMGCLLLLLVMAVWWRWPVEPGATVPDHDVWLAALNAHAAWKSSLVQPTPLAHDHHRDGERVDLRSWSPFVPDLGRAGFRFDGITTTESGESTGLHVGYLGRHGCRVSLVVFREPRTYDTPLRRTRFQAVTFYDWHAGHGHYLLLGPSMDPHRLAGIAGVVWRLTRERSGLDGLATRMLVQARHLSRPCTA